LPRYYSSTATETQLVGSIGSSSTIIEVASTSGFPVSYPYTLVLEIGTDSEEIIDVTSASGTTLTVTRGVDGSAAVAHSAGAKVVHGVTARDFREMQTHMEATSNVHGMGASSQFVGTTDTQTLSNKTLTEPAIVAPAITGGGSWAGSPELVTPTIASFVNAQHSHSDAASGGVLASSGGGGGNVPLGFYYSEDYIGTFTSTGGAQIGGAQFALTAPEEWPDWASGLAIHSQVEVSSNTSSSASLYLWCNVNDTEMYPFYCFVPSPSQGVGTTLHVTHLVQLPDPGSHTVKLFAQMISGSLAVFNRSMWATLF